MHDDAPRSTPSSSASRHRPAPWARSGARRKPPIWRLQLGQLARKPIDGWRIADPVWWPATTRRAFRGLCRALCPPPPAPASDAIYDRIEDEVRRSLRYMHPLFALGLVGMIHILDASPIWAERRPKLLRNLSRDDAADLLQDLTRGALGRQLVFAGRMSILSMYFDLDEVHEAMDYRPVDFMAERIRERRRLIEAQQAEATEPAAGDDAPRIGPWSDTIEQSLAPLEELAAHAHASTSTRSGELR